MKGLITSTFLLSIIFMSCEKEIPGANILSTEKIEQKDKRLLSLDEEIKGLNQAFMSLPDLDSLLTSEQQLLDSIKINIESFSFVEQQRVNLIEEVGRLFDPENFQCPLPKRVVNKIRKLRNKGEYWAPTEIASYIKGLKNYDVYLLPRTNVTVLVHTIKIISGDNEKFWPLGGAFSYENLEYEKFLAKSSYNSFIYTLDCSGYLNAAINGTASIPGADIRGTAESALTTQKSIFLSGGVIVPPIAPALYGNILGIELTKEERVNILEAILKYPELNDSDMISIPNAYEIVWASNTGFSSFNGKASFSGSVGFGLGIAKINASANARGNMTRSSEYNSYNTYLIDREPLKEFKPLSVLKIRELLGDLKKEN